MGGAEVWENITDVEIEEVELALVLSRKKACILGRKLPVDDGGLAAHYGWKDSKETGSRKQLFSFPLTFYCPSSSLWTKSMDKT